MDDLRIPDLTGSPKAAVLLAWLATTPGDPPRPVDAYTASSIPPRRSRLHGLRNNPAGLLAETYNRLDNWRYNRVARDTAASLGPAIGYRRTAAALLRAHAARWWWSPLPRRAQTWICDDPDISTGEGLPFITNYGHHWDATAPAKAFTTSTRLARLPAAQLLSGRNRVTGPTATDLSAWSVQVSDTARVYEIHSPADWVRLVKGYPSHRTDFCLAEHLAAHWPGNGPTRRPVLTPAWDAVSQDYDGVHLSMAGWLTATSHILEVPGLGHTFCEGWATESTRWFKPVFASAFTRLDLGPLEYGYGRGAAGAAIDLATMPPEQRRRWWAKALS